MKNDRSITEEELLTMVEEAQSEGGINDNEGELIKNAIEFYDLEVSDILIPRVDVIAVQTDSTPEEIDQVFKDSRLSRLPVFHETIDSIAGVLNMKDFYYQVLGNREPLESAIKPAVYVLEQMQISDLLKLLQQKKSHLAIVTDEYGGTVGIVTLEDIIEELVGEIWDEHDVVTEEITQISANCYRVSCNASITKMFELFEIDEEIESSTVGGWVMEQLERVPVLGDSFKYQYLTVTVTNADERRPLEIIVTVDSPNAVLEK